jgi:hypothetical protein
MNDDEKAALRYEILAAVYAKAAHKRQVDKIMAKYDAYYDTKGETQ